MTNPANTLRSDELPAGAQPHVWIDASGLTNVGRVRSVNEDAYLIATLQRSMVVHDASPPAAHGWFAGEPAGTLLIIADGMGGQGGGDVASRVAVSTVANYLLNVMPWTNAFPTASTGRDSGSPGVRDQLASALVIGDSTVKHAGLQTGAPRMGTTLTVALVLWPVLYVAHVGDTRCYVLRSGSLTRMTTDHTMAQKFADDAGKPVDPASNLHHVLWNSLGGSEVLPKPDILKLGLELGDRLLLCSDGLTKHVNDEEIAAALASDEPLATRCARLVERANAAGGTDNVTVVIANPRPPANPPSAFAGSRVAPTRPDVQQR
jgi:PPM family protein phosphatase